MYLHKGSTHDKLLLDIKEESLVHCINNIQLVGVHLKDGTVLTNIFGPPSQEGYADIDNLILELCYSSGKILQPEQVDSLIFAGNFPWARSLSDSELIVEMMD